MLPFFVVIPLACAFLISLLGKRIKNLSDILANLGTLALLILSLYSIGLVNNHKILVYKVGGWIPPIGISMVLDGLSSFMLVIVGVVSFLVTVYSINYMERFTDKWKFYTLFMLMLAGMNGVIVSGDLFNLFVFLEIASIASYALVAFGTEAEELEASFKYAIMGSVASSFILLGIAFLYSYTSTLNMADISLVLSIKEPGLMVSFIAVLFLVGFGLKAALVPFHAWLPDAHPSAPAPISAMLSGVFIKILGVYALCRVFFNILGVSDKIFFVLTILGVISMILGAFLAIAQSDIKRMFAYSSISQIGFIIFALGIGSPLALLGGLFHLFNHAIFKSLLFLNSGAVEYSTGVRDLKRLGGLNSRLPITGFTGLLGAMSISGIPPLGGFWSKLIIIIAAVQAGYFMFASIAILISIVTLAYYLKFLGFTFFGKLDDAWLKIKEVPWAMRFSMIILAIICVITGLLLIPILRPFLQSAVEVLLSGREYSSIVFGAIR
ncbi:MAG: NADH/ubiquinone/plastoquinone (complex I) [Candidatus Omnitrophica bacterium]|nr:NADH/ubiquinone/plastoquinone (complex I) [Candidatus Omnitrophota bacterium]MBU4472944.1 NADH/ubiquinone/plastoquinone (complex I) [Candidatus Omnitrophota bacterium]MCG2706362.1 NADH/ubiquinone/plastoquinone (complex I) [Candidatus Omnitrophota bacterium]